MKRLAIGVLACLFLLPTAAAAESADSAIGSSTPVGAALSDYPSACPQMTDSIYRLYTAYFLREPDTAGWAYWFDRYGSNINTNLEVVSEAFAASDEFRNTYGALNNAEFVTLIYRNVLDRAPDTAGFNHWKAALDGGYLRGSVMIAFSESSEYVRQTGTLPPLAGDLTWYDRGLIFYCDIVDFGDVEFGIPANIPSPHVDVYIENLSEANITAGIAFYTGTTGELYDAVTIAPGFYSYNWNIPIVITEDAVAVGADGQYAYTVVFYDHPHSANRVGWE